MDPHQKTDALVDKFRSLGIEHVYVNPPEGIHMNYPCVRIKRSDIYTLKANNKKYLMFDRFDVTYITYEPDDPMVYSILNGFEHSRYSRQVVNDNLYNENLVIYF